MRPKNPLFQKCIAYLESLPNINATIQDEPYFSGDFLADGELIISISNKTAHYICEIKTGITNDLVEQVSEYFIYLKKRLNGNQKPLLITRNLSSLVMNKLLEKNIEFIDVDGKAYLNSSDIYMLVRNQVAKDILNKPLEITSTVLQVMYALLSYPKLISKENNENNIAYFSGVSPKTVKSVLKKLHDLKYIRRSQEGYEIVNYTRLLERWELGYAERLRAKLLIKTYTSIEKQNLSDIKGLIKTYAREFKYLIGGELGASIITNYLRPISVVLHLHKETIEYHREIAVLLRLKPDPEGNITFVQNIGEYDGYDYGELANNIINPLLIHAELVRTGDSRLKETAQLIFDKYIEEIE